MAYLVGFRILVLKEIEMRKISLNRNKSIGKVVFIVEGDKKEHTLLAHIFRNILDYSIVDVKSIPVIQK